MSIIETLFTAIPTLYKIFLPNNSRFVADTILNNLQELNDQVALLQEFFLILRIKLNFFIIGIQQTFQLKNTADSLMLIQAKLNELSKLKEELKDTSSSTIIDAELIFSQSYIYYKYRGQLKDQRNEYTKHIEKLEKVQESIRKKEGQSTLEARIGLLISKLWFAFTAEENIGISSLEKKLESAITIFEKELLNFNPNTKRLELKACCLLVRLYQK